MKFLIIDSTDIHPAYGPWLDFQADLGDGQLYTNPLDPITHGGDMLRAANLFIGGAIAEDRSPVGYINAGGNLVEALRLAVEWANGEPIRIGMPLGFPNPDGAVRDALHRLPENVQVFIATGNQGLPEAAYPARYALELDRVYSVGVKWGWGNGQAELINAPSIPFVVGTSIATMGALMGYDGYGEFQVV